MALVSHGDARCPSILRTNHPGFVFASPPPPLPLLVIYLWNRHSCNRRSSVLGPRASVVRGWGRCTRVNLWRARDSGVGTDDCGPAARRGAARLFVPEYIYVLGIRDEAILHRSHLRLHRAFHTSLSNFLNVCISFSLYNINHCRKRRNGYFILNNLQIIVKSTIVAERIKAICKNLHFSSSILCVSHQ